MSTPPTTPSSPAPGAPPPTTGRPSRVKQQAPIRAGSSEEYVAVAGACFSVLAVACLWFAAHLLLLSGLSADRAQSISYPKFRTDLAQATAPTGGALKSGTPVALITIPEIGFRKVVVEGTTAAELRGGPGHRRDTVLPGQVGVSYVLGRAATYGGPFRTIPGLAIGQRIIVDMAEGRVTYTVRDVRRAGDPVPAAPTGTEGRLSLVTAEGKGPLAALNPSSVVYVDAVAAKAFPASGPAVTVVPASEQAMGTDSSALPLLALSLAALLGIAYVAVTQWLRRQKALVWVITAPVVLAVAWFTSDVVVRLLPNLM